MLGTVSRQTSSAASQWWCASAAAAAASGAAALMLTMLISAGGSCSGAAAPLPPSNAAAAAATAASPVVRRGCEADGGRPCEEPGRPPPVDGGREASCGCMRFCIAVAVRVMNAAQQSVRVVLPAAPRHTAVQLQVCAAASSPCGSWRLAAGCRARLATECSSKCCAIRALRRWSTARCRAQCCAAAGPGAYSAADCALRPPWRVDSRSWSDQAAGLTARSLCGTAGCWQAGHVSCEAVVYCICREAVVAPSRGTASLRGRAARKQI